MKRRQPFIPLVNMPLTDSTIINMHPDGVAPDKGLTVEKLERMLRDLQRIGPLPPPFAFDLYGNQYITDVLEINTQMLPTHWMRSTRPRGRRILIVPKDRLGEIARTLCEAGADVRIEPRYGALESPSEDNAQG